MKNSPALYIFDGLSQEEINYFLLMCEPLEFRTGECIMREGDESDFRAYCIEEGTVRVLRDGKEITTLSPWALFGEIALLTNDPRTATIEATTPLKVLALHRDEFLMLTKKSGHFESIQKEIFRRIQSNFASDRAE